MSKLSKVVAVVLFIILVIASYYMMTSALSRLSTVATNLISEKQDGETVQLSLFQKILKQNYLFLVTGVLGIATSVLTALYWIGRELFRAVSSKFVTTISLNNADDAYNWLMQYLGNQHTLFMRQKDDLLDEEADEKVPIEAKFITGPSLMATVQRLKRKRWYQTSTIDDGQAVHIQYVPEDGFHMFTFKGKLFWFEKHKAQDSVTAGMDKSTNFTLETCDLCMLGNLQNKANQEILMDLFYSAMHSVVSNNKDVLRIYTVSRWSGWNLALAKAKRPFHSVILDKSMAENLLQDAKNFLSRKDWYTQKGIPFRRGYLLHGLPGTGKSSFVSALASKLNLNICVLDLNSGIVGDQELAHKLQSAPPNSVILLEDVDAIFVDRNTPDSGKDKDQQVTFAGLLNAIDGIAAPESGRLLFMTTNHIEKLDPALIRAGRCDVKVEFTYATRSQVGVAFRHFYSDCTEDQVKRFCDAIETEGEQLTMAQVLNHLSRFKSDPEKSIETVSDGFIKRIRKFSLEERTSTGLPIDQWLKRLGLARHSQAFKKEKVRHILDLGEDVQPNIYEINAYCDQQRFIGMINGKKDAVSEFQTVTIAEVKRILTSWFISAPEDFVTKFLKQVSNQDISFFELKSYLNTFKHRYYTCPASDRKKVLDDILANIESELINPPSFHLKVPDAKDLVNKHTGKSCTEITDDIDLRDYGLKIEYENAADWVKQLNKENKWWSPRKEAPKTQSAIKTATENKKKKKTDKKPITTVQSPADGTEKDSKTVTEEKGDDKPKEESKPESLEFILEKLKEEKIETIQDLISYGATSESKWESAFNIKLKGRRLKIARLLNDIKEKVSEFDQIKDKWVELFEL